MIISKSAEELALMKHAGRIVALVLYELGNFSKPGVKTKQLDDLGNKIIKEEGAEPAFLGYKGFPCSVCTSINEQVVHGIPGKRVLKSGDLLSLDVGVKHEGYYCLLYTS
ncbi:MAG TPA: M24 family metallopeptidase, partial [Actinobacteria bacterium]|nr:M24 family metallopeptidase [Actinomycetota bacterium]